MMTATPRTTALLWQKYLPIIQVFKFIIPRFRCWNNTFGEGVVAVGDIPALQTWPNLEKKMWRQGQIKRQIRMISNQGKKIEKDKDIYKTRHDKNKDKVLKNNSVGDSCAPQRWTRPDQGKKIKKKKTSTKTNTVIEEKHTKGKYNLTWCLKTIPVGAVGDSPAPQSWMRSDQGGTFCRNLQQCRCFGSMRLNQWSALYINR